jgi:hypothetical protein
MRRTIFLVLLTATAGGQGCLGVDKLFWERQQVDVNEPKPAPLSSPAPVTAESINEANAKQKLEALAAELSRDESEVVPQPASPPQQR